MRGLSRRRVRAKRKKPGVKTSTDSREALLSRFEVIERGLARYNRKGVANLSAPQRKMHADFTKEKARTELALGIQISAPASFIQFPGSEIPRSEVPTSDINQSHQDTETPYMDQSQSSIHPIEGYGTPNQPGAQNIMQIQQAPPTRPCCVRRKDPVVPPSAASGGVPEPHPLYLFHSKVSSQSEDPPQPKLLVIDLNGTLLHRRKSRASNFKVRPSAKTFLNFVLENFNVMIWSSARPSNVREICKRLISEEARQSLLAEWSRDHLGLHRSDYSSRIQVYKRLWKVWDDPDIQARHPFHSLGLRWGQHNTVLIDDSMEKARSEPHNLVQVPEYTGIDEDDDALKPVAEYLYRLRGQTNVSAYIREHPFKMLG